MQMSKWTMISLLALGLGLAACGEDDPTTGTLNGVVTDMQTGAVLAGITVTTDPATETVTTAADGSFEIEDVDPANYVLHFSAAGYVPEQGEAAAEAGETATTDVAIGSQHYHVAEAARSFLALSKLETSDPNYFSPITTATALHDKLYDSDSANDPLVVSVRAGADYAAGHVPTAINIGWKAVADDASLATLGDPATAKPIVDYCYTGNTGGIASSVLNMLGYRAQNMKYGIVAWTPDTTARGANGVEPDLTKDFTVETDVNTATETFTPPLLASEGVETPQDAVQAAAQAYLANPVMAPTIGAQTLFDNLNDGNADNDPFIISVRKATDYAIGHIPGAINIPWNDIALAENLAKIPTDRDIVVYCYTGHTGAVATGVLGVLGYHKVKNLKYGMAGWTQDASVRATTVFDAATDVKDFAIVTGTEPGTITP